MPAGKKWSNANATVNQASNVSKSAGLGTFDVAKVTDLRVSSIQGTHFSESAANVKGPSYGSGDFAGLTISAETIRYEGGGKLADYKDSGYEIEQHIQPLSFYNNFDGSGNAHRGVIAHALQKDASDANDPYLKISAFGMFAAPNENLVLTVAESDGGIFNYLEGNASAQLATGKTAITVDASNRVFIGAKGQDLKPGGLDYLIKGSSNAQLYVNGDIVVDGSGVQIDKYLVDDIFVGSSAAIMGAGLSGENYYFYNDISNSVQDLSVLLTNTESTTGKAGYLFVANNSSFFGNVGISGGATLGDGLTLDNSGYWIDGSYSTLNITTPIDGHQGSVNGISYKSIDSNMYDYGYDSRELISTFQHAIYDGSDSALLLHHSSPNTSQGSLIFLRTIGSAGEGSTGAISDTDVTGEIQFRGYKNGSQISTGHLTSTGAGNINLYAPNDITIDGSSSVILKTNVTGQDVSNNITYSQDKTTSDTAAVAIIHPGSVSANDYNTILDTHDMAIPTVHYVKNIDYWMPYQQTGGGDFDTITLNNTKYPDVSNIYIPGKVECPNLKVPEHFKTVCYTEVEQTHWWIFPTGERIVEVCTTVPDNPVVPPAITDFSSTVFFEAPVTMRYGSTHDLSLTDAALYIAPLNADESASMSLISSRTAETSDEQNATVYFGTKWATGNNQFVIHNIGAIQGEIETGQSVGNMLFYGSDDNQNLKTFMEYHGGSSPYTEINRVDGSGAVLMINDFTDIPSSNYTASNLNSSSTAKLSLQRSNGQDPSSNPTGVIAEIDFNGYANALPSTDPSGISNAATIKCYNTGVQGSAPESQGQTGLLTISVFDNTGLAGSGNGNRDALNIDNFNRIFINSPTPSAATYINSNGVSSVIIPPAIESYAWPTTVSVIDFLSINPTLTVLGGNNQSGIIAAEGGYITGTYLPADASGYYMADVSYVNTHSTNWQISGTTLSPKEASITVVEAPSFNATSDIAKKENIQTISGALESINELRGVSYNLKTDETKKTHHGVIAQEIEKIFPDMVAGEEGSKSVAYMEIIGVLIEAVKDLKKRVEELENK